MDIFETNFLTALANSEGVLPIICQHLTFLKMAFLDIMSVFNFLKNNVLNYSTHPVHGAFAMMAFIVEPAQGFFQGTYWKWCRSKTSVENGLIKCAGRKSFHLLHKTKCCWQLCRYAVIQLNDIFAKRNAKVWIEKFSVSLDFIYTTSYKGQFVIIYFPSDTFLTYDTLEPQSWS